jgi:hypothetical protein
LNNSAPHSKESGAQNFMDHSEENELAAHNNEVRWDEHTQSKFEQMIAKIPVFLRPIARDKVSKKAEDIVRSERRSLIGEKDLVDAFFSETPFGFHGPMKTDMDDVQLDYTKYGYPK